MLQHIIITPFSFRRIDYQPDVMPNPLKAIVLKKRFRFFEMITLPSIKAQENRNFTWIIVIDPLLPAAYRNMFSEVLSGMKNVFLQNFSKEVSENSTGWMKPYIHHETNYLITSELDADDGVFRDFTRYVQNYYSLLIEGGQIQPIHFMSCKNVFQWDFFYTSKAPFGFIKPWTRVKTPTVTAGLTACCKYPEMDISIFNLDHRLVGFLFADKNKNDLELKDIEGLELLKNIIKEKSESGGLNWHGEMCSEQNFHQVFTNQPQALIINNFLNDRFVRVFENQEMRNVFDPQTSVPGIEIDYELAARLIKTNRKTLPMLVRILWMFLFEKNYVVLTNNKLKLRRAVRLVRSFCKM